MKTQVKIRPSAEGEFDIKKTYEELSLVYYSGSTYISRKAVPSGIAIDNTEYWQLFTSSGAYIGIDDIGAYIETE